MFTGLVEEIGVLRAARRESGGLRLTVHAQTIMNDLRIDDSVAINGVCQTVVARSADTFDVQAVEETLRKTTFSSLSVGEHVNLERALTLSARLGGHLVQGHVDTTASVISIENQSASVLVWIEIPQEFARYVIPVGSICVNGVSLTAAQVLDNRILLSVIPHTWKNTTLKILKSGSHVNIEFDLIGKYVEKMLLGYGNPNEQSKLRITKSWLEEMGY